MKKIIISTYDDIKNPVYGGGGAIAIHELAKRLLGEYDVQILSWNHSGQRKEVIDRVEYKRIGVKSINPKIGMLIFQSTLPIFAIFKEYDLWLESFSPPFTTAFLPLFTKRKIVGVVHMLAAEDMERKYGLPFHLIQNIGLRKYKRIITTSDFLRHEITKITPKSQVEVISNGVDRIIPNTSHNLRQLLFLGRIEINQKGLDLLIESFEKFKRKNNTRYRLIIAGTGTNGEIQKLRKLIKNSEFRKEIIFKGKVTGKEKEKLLSRSTFMVVSSRFETFSMVILEAMAHALPVLCFDIQGLSWVPEKIVEKVRPYNTEELSSRMSQLVENKTRITEMKRTGMKYVKEFTWENIANSYKKYIKNVFKYE